MRKFKSIEQAPRYLGAPAAVYNLFNLGRHMNPVFAVGSENPVEAGQIHTGLGYQRPSLAAKSTEQSGLNNR